MHLYYAASSLFVSVLALDWSQHFSAKRTLCSFSFGHRDYLQTGGVSVDLLVIERGLYDSGSRLSCVRQSCLSPLLLG